jgi:2-oxoglutarate dehydrogenase E2 component (dihydrolipoamide succinyltransferase)
MDHPGDVTFVPHTTIRKRIARHMAASSAAAAHVYAMTDVDYSAVDEVRRHHRVGYLPFVARSVAIAIGQYPELNARFTDAGLEISPDLGLGIAVDLDFRGLIVPVIPRANMLDVPAIAASIVDLGNRARAGNLRGEDVAGGTFTLSNPGPFGARITLPIINQPQVAILTVDAIARRPAAVPDGAGGHTLAIRPIGNLTLAWDHRAFDGAYAASALSAIRETLQSHDWLAEARTWNDTEPPVPAALPS